MKDWTGRRRIQSVASRVAFLAGLIITCGMGTPATVKANPSGPTVAAGQATISGLGTPQVLIQQQTSQAIINWNQFNIGPNEVTRFIQPSSSSIALNRIFDRNPSQIFGRLEANGSLILLNRNGIVFGPQAQVNVNGLIASSLSLSNEQFLAGQYLFQGQIANGVIQNFGEIHGGSNGVYLLAPHVVNSGIITSPEGTVALGAGTKAYLSQRPDGEGLMVEVQAPAGEARNLGQIFADGGHVSLAGFAVNQEGLIQANTVRENNGVIELIAQQDLTIKSGSQTVAKGEDSQPSQGGTIIALSDKSKGTTRFEKGAVIDVSGGQLEGDGGFAEVSGGTLSMGGSFKAGAARGSKGGTILIDPFDLTVDDNALLSFNGSNASEIVFQADNNLTVQSAFNPAENWQWSLPEGKGTLRFEAGNTIRFNDLFGAVTLGDSSLTEVFDPALTVPTPWDIVAKAGQDVIFGQVNRTGNTISTVINGGILMASRGANITLEAGRDIGLVPLTATGTSDPAAGTQGALSTLGGNITLKAGRNLISPMASNVIANFLPGGIRLEGKGNLTVEVGGNWLGSGSSGIEGSPGFLLTDGKANVTIQGQIGSAQQYLNLTVGKVEEVVIEAGKSVYLGLVQDKGLVENRLLTGLDTLTVDSGNRMRVKSQTGDIHLNPAVPNPGEDPFNDLRSYYPASFSAEAPNGNIFLETNLNFWPSPTGTISLQARHAILGEPDFLVKGTGKNANGNELRFDGDNNPVAVFLNGVFLNRIQLGILGKTEREINNLLTEVKVQEPRFLQRRIGVGDADVELIKTAVENNDQIALKSALAATAQGVPEHGPASISFRTELGNIERVLFDIQSFAFRKTVNVEAGQDLKSFGVNVAIPAGTQAVVKAGRDIDMTVIPNTPASGMTFAGQGAANIFAGRNLDLADSFGIQHRSTFIPNSIPNQGGFLDIRVGGNLNMTQSRIVTWNGADILIHGIQDPPPPGSPDVDGFLDAVGGTVNVGTNAPPTGLGGATGIFTVLGGDLTIRSKGNVEVNRSRVATFGGGNISILTNPGDINAGFGGKDDLVTFQLRNDGLDADGNPISQILEFDVPGSGIYTFHPEDPFPVVFPEFDTPAIISLKHEKIKQNFFGRNTDKLDRQIQEAVKVREPIFNGLFTDFITKTPIRAGDITLTARNAEKTGAIVVPPAGIRGRRIEIDSDLLDLQGGTISGLINIQAGTVQGAGPGSFSGVTSGTVSASGGAGGGTLAPLAGSTGTVTTSTSSTAGSAGTTAESAAEAQEETTKTAKQEAQAQAQSQEGRELVGSGSADGSIGQSLSMGRGVTIEVEVKEEKKDNKNNKNKEG